MHTSQIWQQFIYGLRQTTALEYLAVFSGIASVWFSVKENILVYPVGLLSTVIYIYISLRGGLLGEASVNFYYTVMSVAGWLMWAKKDIVSRPVLQITSSSLRENLQQIFLFILFYVVLYYAIGRMSTRGYITGAIPAADAFASAAAYTGMWLMNRKKIESWYWWIATNIASIPLYFVKGYVFSAVYYVVLLVMAVFGLISWINNIKTRQMPAAGHIAEIQND